MDIIQEFIWFKVLYNKVSDYTFQYLKQTIPENIEKTWMQVHVKNTGPNCILKTAFYMQIMKESKYVLYVHRSQRW